jgi:hypothetical protein
VNGRQKFLGRFDSEQEGAQELFGVYAKLNFKGWRDGDVDGIS